MSVPPGQVAPDDGAVPRWSADDSAIRGWAISLLLTGLPHEQRAHATRFLLDELERLYIAAGCSRPAWIDALRDGLA
jgi:hypothetical protein